MKGILICGGKGTRLLPLTKNVPKSLIPVGGKPMVLYPLQVLLDAGITDIAIIAGPEFVEDFKALLGSGEKWKCSLTYCVQKEPGGIAQALGLAESFAGGDSVCVLLGDNIFEDNLSEHIHNFSEEGGHLFLKEVNDPERFGVAEMAEEKVISMEEKPKEPKTNLAVTGCYLYGSDCFEIIHDLKPSARGELEITDVSKVYLERGELTATVLEGAWVDAGTHESLKVAEKLVQSL